MLELQLLDEIAGYEVLTVLGYGASSTIFAVRDPKDSHVYAIKRVVRRTPSDQRFIDQALTEHEVASRINHPNCRKSHRVIRRRKILRTSEVLVLMELVDGETFEQYRPNSLRRLVELFMEVTHGLEAIHQQSFCHCDIKPNNILLTAAGGVKLIDFGQACPTGTIKQRVQGTPDYIAPEQVLRKRITPATDVFNLGATMYWCLTSHHVPTLIPKGSEREVALKPDTTLRQVTDYNPGIPAALNALIMACVQTEPDDRPVSMREVRGRLDVVCHQLNNGRSTRSA